MPDYTNDIPPAKQYAILIALSSVCFGIAFYICIQPFNVVVAFIGLVGMGLFSIIHVIRSLLTRLKTGEKEQQKAKREIFKAIDFSGDEVVLDVGCKSGLIAHSIAKKMITGKVVGSNYFCSEDFSAEKELFLSNSTAEGVLYKVSYDDKSDKYLSFNSNTFDVVISALNCGILVGDDICTFRKINEIVRVLNPQGVIAIYDEPLVVEICHNVFVKLGFEVVQKSKHLIVCRKSR